VQRLTIACNPDTSKDFQAISRVAFRRVSLDAVAILHSRHRNISGHVSKNECCNVHLINTAS
jgi:hypothetical protein